MAERYQILFHNGTPMYQDNCPVIVSAFNVLLDTIADETILQVKFENLGKKAVKEITLNVIGLDVNKNTITQPQEITYVVNDGGFRKTFSDREAKFLSDKKIRKVNIKITEVVFTDDNSWQSAGDEMKPVPVQQTIDEYFSSVELVKEFERLTPEINTNRKVIICNENIWLCSCGKINLVSEESCYHCSSKKINLLHITDKTVLQNSIAEEKEKERILQEEKAKKKERKRKRTIKLTLLLIITVTAGFVINANLPTIIRTINAKKAEKLPNIIKVGDNIIYGVYEQDNLESNGPEVISWTVLAVEDNKALLLADNILDIQKYHDKVESVSWEDSTLRSWLNNEFIHTAFTNKQINNIVDTELTNPAVQKYSTYSSTTVDKIFILSNSEAKEFKITSNSPFSNYRQSLCSLKDNIYWERNLVIWITNTKQIAYSNLSNNTNSTNIIPTHTKFYSPGFLYGVRPAMWVELPN